MPGATTCRGYPYPLDTDLIDIAKHIKNLADALDIDLCGVLTDIERTPLGTIRETIKESADPGWALMGTTLVNAITAFPEFWALAPVIWRSGNNIVLPVMTDRVVSGAANTAQIGVQGGSNTRQITAANLPLHQHSIDHTHAAINTGTESADHAHGISFNSGGVVAVDAGSSIVLTPSDPAYGFVVQRPGGNSGFVLISNGSGSQIPATLPYTSPMPYSPPANHVHSINGATQGRNAAHSHTVPASGFSGSSGNGGFANTAMDVRQAFLSVVYQIRVTP